MAPTSIKCGGDESRTNRHRSNFSTALDPSFHGSRLIDMTATLTGLTWDDPRGYGPLATVRAAVEAELGERVAVCWKVQPLGGFESGPLAEVVRQYDLVVMDHPHTAEAALAGLLAPMGRLEEPYVGLSLESYQHGGEQWATPVDAACQVAAYHPQAVAAAPATWQEVFRLIDNGVRVAIPLKGVHSLMALLSTLGGIDVGGPANCDWMTSREVVHALEMLHEVVWRTAGLGLDWNPIDALKAVAERRCDYLPLVFGYAHWQSRGVQFAASPSIDATRPSATVMGGAGMAVSAFSKQRDLAIRYARACGSAKVQSYSWPTEGGQPAHCLAWDRLAGGNSFYRTTRSAMEQAFLRPRRADWNSLQTQTGTLIERWLRANDKSTRRLQQELHRLWNPHVRAALASA